MKQWVFLFALFCFNACVTLPQIAGGQRVAQPGVSFIPPAGKPWSVLMQSTYQIALGARGSSENETFVTNVSIYQLPSTLSPQQFLAHVRAGRAAEPQTGRFEVISNEEQLYADRPETCVKHRASSKDYGAGRGADFTVIDYLGMNCIHPKAPRVGILVELSRKSPPSVAGPSFEALGMSLLRSVEFTQFK